MATEKTLNTRIKLKYDLYENWSSTNPKLLAGEVAIAYVPTDKSVATGNNTVSGTTPPNILIKVGDGTNYYNSLKFISALAADVNSYAKLSATDFEAAVKGFASAELSGDIKDNADAIDALEKLVGTTAVDTQISNAIAALELAKTYAAKEHKHTKSDITDFAHTHYISEVPGLDDALNDRMSISVYDEDEDGIVDLAANSMELEGHGASYFAKASDIPVVTNDLTNELKGQYDAAYTHSQAAHAPANAQANVIESVKVNGSAVTVTGKAVDISVPTDNAQLANGAGYLVAGDIANKADKATTLAGYGITDAYTQAQVDNKITGEINAFVSAYITADGGAIDKMQEIANWIDSDKDGAADIIADVEANAEAIKKLNGDKNTAGSVDKKIADAIAAENLGQYATDGELSALNDTVTNTILPKVHEHGNKALLDTYTQTEADLADAVSKKHAHTNATELAKIANGDKDKWDAAAGKAHEHSNKELLDSYTQTEANLKDAVDKKHAHSNKSVLDGITSTKVSAWDAAEQNAKDYADGLAGNYATSAQGSKADSAIQTVTSVANNGIKVDVKDNVATIDWDTNVTLIFDCGNATI